MWVVNGTSTYTDVKATKEAKEVHRRKQKPKEKEEEGSKTSSWMLYIIFKSEVCF